MAGRPGSVRVLAVGLLALPLAGLLLLLAAPPMDVTWQNQPSHFWLVLSLAVLNVVLGVLTGESASRRDDPRVFLVSLALLASAGFLGLHALSTPGVLAHKGNTGFVIATPLGLLLASVFAAMSATDLDRTLGPGITASQRLMRRGLLVVLVVWAIVSIAHLPLLDREAPEEAPTVIRVLAPIGIGLYAYAAHGYWRIYRQRHRSLPLAISVAFVLLAEAMVAVAISRTWHATWWEWHILMAIAFGAITLAVQREYRRDRSLTGALGGLYLEQTLQRLDRRYSDGLAAVVDAVKQEQPLTPVLDELRRDGFSSEELTVLERSAYELSRVDQLLRGYVGSDLVDSIETEPALGELGGREMQVSVLFADLVGFTTFSEHRAPNEVISMLNAYWTVSVPAIVGAGGLVERFAGDAVLAVFNALGEQPDHAVQAVRAALALARRNGSPRRGQSRLAALPRRGEHRLGGHRQRGRGVATELHGHRGHDQRGGPAPDSQRTGSGPDRAAHPRARARPVHDGSVRGAPPEGQGRTSPRARRRLRGPVVERRARCDWGNGPRSRSSASPPRPCSLRRGRAPRSWRFDRSCMRSSSPWPRSRPSAASSPVFCLSVAT